MHLREATFSDLDAITEIALAAFPQDPQWDYRFPRRLDFPEDTRLCTRLQYKTYFESPKGSVCIFVVIAPTLEDPDVKKPVSVAVWECKPQKKEIGEPYDPESSLDACDSRRDANRQRMEAFSQALVAGQRKYFDNVYGAKHLHLRIMATHPDYQRRGAGTMLCNWGISEVQKKNSRISVFASPMGKLLYTHLGFEELGVVVVQVEGEEEKLIIPAMLYEPSRGKGSWCSVS